MRVAHNKETVEWVFKDNTGEDLLVRFVPYEEEEDE